MVERILLSRRHWQAMRRHVSRCAPHEACGLLAGRDGRVERTLGVPNAERSPVRFRMQPRLQLRAFLAIETAGLELVAIYQSHPDGPDHPSPTDLRQAAYPVPSVIWFRRDGRWRARGFRLGQGTYTEIPLQIVN